MNAGLMRSSVCTVLTSAGIIDVLFSLDFILLEAIFL